MPSINMAVVEFHVYINAMNQAIINSVLAATSATAITKTTVLQSLWSGYGEIVRLQLEGSEYSSVILKHIKLPEQASHPRGWNTGLSHQRKIRSYQVEACWYQQYAYQCGNDCPVPSCLLVDASENETVLLLTDLDAAGFHVRKESAEIGDIHACLNWLASFHARFLESTSDGLWECGSYWHLATRPDELAAMEDIALRDAAHLIDQQLSGCRYQTLVHGDAKLANFCFSDDTPQPKVSAVDFQYVGRGCGMKDVAYFIGSCLSEEECAALEEALLAYYFSALKSRVKEKQQAVDTAELEQEWRALYAFAWADFHRFLKGWSPGHWKINSYSERLTRSVLSDLQS
ncbi:MAG: oxidoreductase family protein [Pseudomonadales bacterium]